MDRTYTYATVQTPMGHTLNLPPFVTQTVLNALSAEFQARPDDVFIVTYTRSGTTWMQQIAHLLRTQGVQGERHLEEVIPYLEKYAAFNGLAGLDALPAPRYFKTHLPYALVPGTDTCRARYIYVARNPKDVALSNYFFYANNARIAYDGDWNAYCALFLRGATIYGSWFEHVLRWWQASRQSERILFVRYEDLHRTLPEVITRVAEFIQVSLTAELLQTILTQSSFGYMASQPTTNLGWAAWRTDATTRPLRKGAIGDWKNHFSPAQNAAYERQYQQSFANTGLQFDFEE